MTGSGRENVVLTAVPEYADDSPRKNRQLPANGRKRSRESLRRLFAGARRFAGGRESFRIVRVNQKPVYRALPSFCLAFQMLPPQWHSKCHSTKNAREPLR